MEHHTHPREIVFDRWWNVRDLGGLPAGGGGITRAGVLIRAASPQYATAADVAGARELGLTTFVDLRRPDHDPDWRAAAPGVRTVDFDLVASIAGRPDPGIDGAGVPRFLLDAGRVGVAGAVGAITRAARESMPVVFHCYTGKDRTGVIAIVFLSLAGVPDELTIEDYVASNPGFEEMRLEVGADGGAGFQAGAPTAVRGPVSRAGAEGALGFLREAGGVEEYLLSGGLTGTEVEAAAALLR